MSFCICEYAECLPSPPSIRRAIAHQKTVTLPMGGCICVYVNTKLIFQTRIFSHKIAENYKNIGICLHIVTHRNSVVESTWQRTSEIL